MYIHNAATAAEYVASWAPLRGQGRSHIKYAIEALERSQHIDRGRGRVEDRDLAEALSVLRKGLRAMQELAHNE